MSSQTISSLLIEIGVEVNDADKAAKAVTGVEGAAEKLQKEGGKSIQTFGGEFSKMLTITAGDLANFAKSVPKALIATAKAVFNFVDETTAATAKLSADAKASGLSTDEFQRLGKAAEKSGTSAETASKGIRKLNSQMLEAASGGAVPFTNSLSDIGLSLEDLKGKTATEQLGLIGDALNNISDEATRSALSAKIFGEESGPQLASLLAKGTDGIKDLTQAATGIISPEAIRKSQEFQDRMKEVEAVLTDVKVTIATALSPILEDLIEIFQDFIQENEEWLELGMDITVEALSNSFENLYGFVDDSTRAFRELLTVTTFLNTAALGSIPAWDAIAKSLLTIRNPMKDVTDLISLLLEQLETLVLAVPGLAKAAKGMGIDVEAIRAARNARRQSRYEGERRSQRNVNLEGQGGQRETAEGKLGLAEKNNAKMLVASTARTGERFSQDQRSYLALSGMNSSEIDAMEKKNVDRGGARGRGAKGGRGAKAKPEKDKPEAVLETRSLLGQTLARLGSAYSPGDLPGLKKLSTEKYTPEVVMTINNYNFKIDQEIKGQTDPVMIGKQVAVAIKQEFNVRLARAGSSVSTNVAR